MDLNRTESRETKDIRHMRGVFTNIRMVHLSLTQGG